MKLALVIPGFQSSPDDWCIPVFTNLARELSSQVELHVFALRYPGRRERYSIGNVYVHALGGGAFARRRVPGVSLLRLWRSFTVDVHREHKSSPFSAVMGIWATEAGWLATRVAKLIEVPSLVHLAGGELVRIPQIGYGNHGRGLSGRLVTSTLRHADLLTVPSSPMRKALLQQGGVSPERVRGWAPGVGTQMFAPTKQNHKTGHSTSTTFVNVGSLIPVKGQDLLVRAVARARETAPDVDIRLRIAGEGVLRDVLNNLISDLDLTGYVTLEGDIPHEELPHLYNCADAFILGSWHESQCMAALEAMACGLPWVAPPVGAIVDVSAVRKSPRGSGIIFDRRDPDLVARAMIRLATMSLVERQELGRNARKIVQEQYDMEKQAAMLLDILGQLTGS
ncbi:MAG: glycosyltransferase [Chloroflexota bacterium]